MYVNTRVVRLFTRFFYLVYLSKKYGLFGFFNIKLLNINFNNIVRFNININIINNSIYYVYIKL